MNSVHNCLDSTRSNALIVLIFSELQLRYIPWPIPVRLQHGRTNVSTDSEIFLHFPLETSGCRQRWLCSFVRHSLKLYLDVCLHFFLLLCGFPFFRIGLSHLQVRFRDNQKYIFGISDFLSNVQLLNIYFNQFVSFLHFAMNIS
jgi:hypothetical protein